MLCSFHSCRTPDNFVPDVLTMTGSIRSHSDAAQACAQGRLKEIACGVAAAYGCTAEVEFHPGVPATVNSAYMTGLARKAAEELVGAERIVSPRPDMGSEDFAVFRSAYPLVLLLAGLWISRPQECLLAK